MKQLVILIFLFRFVEFRADFNLHLHFYVPYPSNYDSSVLLIIDLLKTANKTFFYETIAEICIALLFVLCLLHLVV